MGGHEGAIAQFIVPVLLCFLCGLASWGLYMHKEFMARNEKEHGKFGEIEADHERRLTRVETRVEHAQDELLYLRGGGHGKSRED